MNNLDRGALVGALVVFSSVALAQPTVPKPPAPSPTPAATATPPVCPRNTALQVDADLDADRCFGSFDAVCPGGYVYTYRVDPDGHDADLCLSGDIGAQTVHLDRMSPVCPLATLEVSKGHDACIAIAAPTCPSGSVLTRKAGADVCLARPPTTNAQSGAPVTTAAAPSVREPSAVAPACPSELVLQLDMDAEADRCFAVRDIVCPYGACPGASFATPMLAFPDAHGTRDECRHPCGSQSAPASCPADFTYVAGPGRDACMRFAAPACPTGLVVAPRAGRDVCAKAP